VGNILERWNEYDEYERGFENYEMLNLCYIKMKGVIKYVYDERWGWISSYVLIVS
jgi:hypothetical protein